MASNWSMDAFLGVVALLAGLTRLPTKSVAPPLENAADIEQALTYASAAVHQHASARVDIVTEPFLPAQHRLDAVATDGRTKR